MKYLYLFLLITLLPLKTQAQEKNFSVAYTSYIVKEFTDQVNEPKAPFDLNAILKKSQVPFHLRIANNISIYRLEDGLALNDVELQMAQLLFGGSDVYYIDLNTPDYINQREAYGEVFLLPIDEWEWTLTQESKKIGAFDCFKAKGRLVGNNDNSEVDKKEITAWYTPKLNVSHGPGGLHGLPGLILEVQYEYFGYIATEVVLDPKKPGTIKKPSKGRKMSIEEFKALKDLSAFSRQ